jgi:flagellar biosynthetic protein FliO
MQKYYIFMVIGLLFVLSTLNARGVFTLDESDALKTGQTSQLTLEQNGNKVDTNVFTNFTDAGTSNAVEAAAESSLTRDKEKSVANFNIWRSIGAIVIVLGILLTINSFIRKKMGFNPKTGQQRNIKIIERLAVDTRRSLLLVEVKGKQILVGVAPERIEFLNEFSNKQSRGNDFAEKE